jgi:type IV pilus assembly protein PilQ
MKMSKWILTLILLAILGSLPALGQGDAEQPATVTDIGFSYAEGKSKLEIGLDRAATFEKNVNTADKQVVIDIKNAKIPAKWARRIDTSQHKSNVSLISPYQSGDVVRIVLQLKEVGDVDVADQNGRLVAAIDNKMPAQANSQEAAEPESVTEAEAPAAESEPEVASTTTSTNTEATTEGSNPTTSLEGFFDSQKSKNYVGKKINVQLRDAPLNDAFRLIGQTSAFNIILTDAVKGNVTIDLIDVPWDQALDLLLNNNKLAAERYGNVLRVTSLEALTKEKELQAAALKATEASEPLVVKVFPLSYADPAKLMVIIEDFLSLDAKSVEARPGDTRVVNSRRGSVKVEERTNSLIVRETISNIEKIKRLIKELDTQTPQILIEAKFVEVKENRSSGIKGRVFATSREFRSDTGAYSFNNGRNNFGVDLAGTTSPGTTSLAGTGIAITQADGGGGFGFMPKASLLPGLGEIGAFLQIAESQDDAKVIASPRVVTQNKQSASLSQGQTIQYFLPGGATGASTIATVTAVLKLLVTPQVTNDGAIMLNVDFSQDAPGATQAGSLATLDTKSVKTNVLVDSGNTLVIGGVYSQLQQDSAAGIPFLRELPIIGPLFGSKSKTNNKTELFIFVTPRILNEKESGISG